MASDFIHVHVDELNGYLEFLGNMARCTLEVQKDGYFNNDKRMQQVSNALNIFEANTHLPEDYLFLIMLPRPPTRNFERIN